jgi:predicted Zn finger-like uncharacterized protein
MSMATRCMACGTIFRVVQDQLKVSEGWVRCGRCDEVFNAIEGLFDLEREPPPPWQPGSAHLLQRESRRVEDAAALDEDDRIASRFFRPEAHEMEPETVAGAAPSAALTSAAAASNASSSAASAAPAALSTHTGKRADHGRVEPRDAVDGRTGSAPRDDDAFVGEAPAFVRVADRKARWSSPRVRLALSLVALLLAGLLALQAAHHFRDDLAAEVPALRPLLARWCGVAGCRVQPPRRIGDISVEHTALTRAATGEAAYQLSVTLRNRADVPVRMPAVDLTLTDTAGQLVARRVLMPADFRVADPVLDAGGEAALQALLAPGDPRVAGYTVEVFYP